VRCEIVDHLAVKIEEHSLQGDVQEGNLQMALCALFRIQVFARHSLGQIDIELFGNLLLHLWEQVLVE